MKKRKLIWGNDHVDELCEYKNLRVVKSILVNIDKTLKKARMLFSANFDHHKVNPLVYIKFWQQALLP